MNILLLGATGSTGRLVAYELINRGYHVKVIVRSLTRLDQSFINNSQIEIIVANICELSECELAEHIRGCAAVVSCLGHNLTFRGVYGHPRKLVSETTKRISLAVNIMKPQYPIKLVLMSTTGYQNLLRNEKRSLAHRLVIYLIRKLVPPHVDNEEAGQYLQYMHTNSCKALEWVTVRPDSLVDQSKQSKFSVYPSPISDPIFSSKETSRINVAKFMVDLISSRRLWNEWVSEMPVIYNE